MTTETDVRAKMAAIIEVLADENLAPFIDKEDVRRLADALEALSVQDGAVNRASVIPCHRGGHHCNWPACSADCDGRPGADAYSKALDGVPTPPPPESAREALEAKSAFKLFKEAGGSQHGPNVERYSIRESDWPAFIALLNHAALANMGGVK